MQHMKVQLPEDGYHLGLISCRTACPVHTDARGYIRAIAEGRFEEAYMIARGPNPFASICGRICGAPCEAACRRGQVPRVDDDGRFVANDRPVAIRALKRFACSAGPAEYDGSEQTLRRLGSYVPKISADAEEMASFIRAGTEGKLVHAEGQRVAIIGAGPAGLSAAHDLSLLGFRPTVFEAEPVPAGMLAMGVPAYRLPREVIRREVSVIQSLGVDIRCGVFVGKDISFGDLRRDFAAVVIAAGAKSSRSLGLPGERGPRVYGGVDLLRAAALGSPIEIGKEVLVIGGGNVAYDVARTVLRQIAYDTARTAARLPATARVRLISLENLEEMPADTLEIIEGDEEGVERLNGWGPLEIERDGNGCPSAVVFRRCFRVYDENNKFAPIFSETERERFTCDTVLLAIGQVPVLTFLEEGGTDIEMARPDWPKIDPETLATTAPGVFVAGDLAHGTRLLIDAVASGKAAARSVYQYITGRRLHADAVTSHVVLDRYERERGYEMLRRVPVPVAPPECRLKEPGTAVETGYSPEEALREAARCLDCAVSPVFDGNRCVLCGGCADVCPTQCLKLVALDQLEINSSLDALIDAFHGLQSGRAEDSAILKDEDRCIRCALCVRRCPAEAITMERVSHIANWRSE